MLFPEGHCGIVQIMHVSPMHVLKVLSQALVTWEDSRTSKRWDLRDRSWTIDSALEEIRELSPSLPPPPVLVMK